MNPELLEGLGYEWYWYHQNPEEYQKWFQAMCQLKTIDEAWKQARYHMMNNTATEKEYQRYGCYKKGVSPYAHNT